MTETTLHSRQRKAHSRPRPGGRLAASPQDDWLSVSLLGESSFCDRAAQFQFEAQSELDENDAPPSKGWFKKPFSIEGAKDLIQAALLRVAGWAISTVVLFLLAASINNLLIIASLFCAYMTVTALGKLCVALYYYFRATQAHHCVIDRGHTQPIKVSWWQLLHMGFSRTFLDKPLKDETWKLVGKPWCLLRQGDLIIPVFRKRAEDYEVKGQHYIRMAAYARLIQTTMGGETPYGIMLCGFGYDATTVPITKQSHKGFHNALERTRKLVKTKHHNAPKNTRRCLGCPWGKPMATRYNALSRSASYESECGNRYHWVPPHRKAIDKDLV